MLKAHLVKTVRPVLKVLRARLVLKVRMVKTEQLDPKEMLVQLVLMDKMGRLVLRAIQEKKGLLDPREYKV